jgi:hypothetical protein
MVALLVAGFLVYKHGMGEKQCKENASQEKLIDNFVRV